ncbi:head-tail adaptor protein [Oceanicola sp. S124]|uniref:head-tail adaptor protein n=1 Tax=Oceanicola sp. S124 TaxID=1042378 RepID=UPI00025596A6|nr:head-tail adaptor protein [Oceanicola sp. S124]
MSPRLNRELILERPVRVADGSGGFESSWDALGILWAEVTPGNAGLRDRADLGAHRQILKIIVRGAPPGASNRPQPGQRFRDGERIYLIDAVQEDDASGRFLRCRAREEVMA